MAKLRSSSSSSSSSFSLSPTLLIFLFFCFSCFSCSSLEAFGQLFNLLLRPLVACGQELMRSFVYGALLRLLLAWGRLGYSFSS